MMNRDLETLGRLRLQGILVLALVFVVGLLAGVASDRAWLARGKPPRPFPPPRGFTPELQDELGLSEEQDRRIRAILDAHRPRVDSILDAFLPRLRAEADSIRAEVRAELEPEQQEIFDRRQPAFGPPMPGPEDLERLPPPRRGPPGRREAG